MASIPECRPSGSVEISIGRFPRSIVAAHLCAVAQTGSRTTAKRLPIECASLNAGYGRVVMMATPCCSAGPSKVSHSHCITTKSSVANSVLHRSALRSPGRSARHAEFPALRLGVPSTRTVPEDTLPDRCKNSNAATNSAGSSVGCTNSCMSVSVVPSSNAIWRYAAPSMIRVHFNVHDWSRIGQFLSGVVSYTCWQVSYQQALSTVLPDSSLGSPSGADLPARLNKSRPSNVSSAPQFDMHQVLQSSGCTSFRRYSGCRGCPLLVNPRWCTDRHGMLLSMAIRGFVRRR